MSRISHALSWKLVALSAVIISTGSLQADAIGSHQTFNVKNFGATGNGTTDDTVAIQSAFNAAANTGAQVTFPAGTYLISNTLNGSGIAVVGANATLSANAPFAMLSLTGTNPSVTSMAFSATSTTPGATGIFISAASNASIVGNSFSNTITDAIFCGQTTGGTITSNNMGNFAGTNAILLFQSSGINVTKNLIVEATSVSGSVGITELTCQNDVIQGNTVSWGTSANTSAISSFQGTASQIIKNTVVGGRVGISTALCTNSLIDHNVVSNSTECGINDVQGTTDTISNNSVTNVANDAIRINGSSGTVVTTNSVNGAGANGIQSATGGNIAITSNALANCALTKTINAVVRVNNPGATTISITGNQYKGNTANVTDFIHVLQTTATVSGNKTNSLLPTVVGP